jgi:hypothetical protein
VRRDLEASEQEYEERLIKARRREEALRRAAKGRVTKRLVNFLVFVTRYTIALTSDALFRNSLREKTTTRLKKTSMTINFCLRTKRPCRLMRGKYIYLQSFGL